MKSIIPLALIATLGLAPIHASAQLSKSDIEVQMKQISKNCLERASVLADAKWSKYKKSPKYREGMLTDKDYETEVNVVQQRCVSVENVLLLRMIKSMVSTDEAVKMKLDNSISEQMLIVEKTL